MVLSSIALSLPRSGESLALIDPTMRSGPPLPHELLPRHSYMVGEDFIVIAEQLARYGYSGQVRIRALVRDQEGNAHRSKPWTIDVDGWLRQAS